MLPLVFYAWFCSQAKAVRERGDAQKALRLLRDGILRFPDNPQLLTSCAVEEGRSRKWDAASRLFSRVAELEPDNPITFRVWRWV
jgi:Flp pilus assembly protein TadD